MIKTLTSTLIIVVVGLSERLPFFPDARDHPRLGAAHLHVSGHSPRLRAGPGLPPPAPRPQQRGQCCPCPSRAHGSPARPSPCQEGFEVVFPHSLQAEHLPCLGKANLSPKRLCPIVTAFEPPAAPGQCSPLSSYAVFEKKCKASQPLCSAPRLAFIMRKT